MNTIAAALLACLTACISTALAAHPAGQTAPQPAAARGHDYVFVFIRTGPLAQPTPEQAQKAMTGHFANMTRLAEAGQLLIAGPFGPPRAEPDHRGLWIFDTTDPAQALEWGATDPAAEMGVFRLEAVRLRTNAPLRELNRLEKEDEARRLADPEIPDEWQGRAYMIATAPLTEATAKAPAADHAGVLIDAALLGPRHTPDGKQTGNTDAAQRLLILDATNEDQARAILGEHAEADEWTLHGWYSSKMVAALAHLPTATD